MYITNFDWHSVNPNDRHSSKGVKSSPVVIGNNDWFMDKYSCTKKSVNW